MFERIFMNRYALVVGLLAMLVVVFTYNYSYIREKVKVNVVFSQGELSDYLDRAKSKINEESIDASAPYVSVAFSALDDWHHTVRSSAIEKLQPHIGNTQVRRVIVELTEDWNEWVRYEALCALSKAWETDQNGDYLVELDYKERNKIEDMIEDDLFIGLGLSGCMPRKLYVSYPFYSEITDKYLSTTKGGLFSQKAMSEILVEHEHIRNQLSNYVMKYDFWETLFSRFGFGFLIHGNKQIRHVVKVLGHQRLIQGSPLVRSALLKALQVDDGFVISDAMDGLLKAYYWNKEIEIILRSHLQSNDYWVRYQALEYLGKMNQTGTETISKAVSLTEDSSSTVRKEALKLIASHCGQESIVQAIRNRMKDVEDEVRKVAVEMFNEHCANK